MYKLRYTASAEAVWDSLPDDARAELDAAIADVCENPYKAADPRSDDPRDVERTLTLQYTVVALVVIDGPPVQRVRLTSIDHLG